MFSTCGVDENNKNIEINEEQRKVVKCTLAEREGQMPESENLGVSIREKKTVKGTSRVVAKSAASRIQVTDGASIAAISRGSGITGNMKGSKERGRLTLLQRLSTSLL
jgi:hypothetical protein